ncbi:hypothetical protein [Methylomonas fluvii]|uniref:Uncharacterized protein n=1 Tax=Methylomonas fluvii TaxID=1854564 RepID=A0ABR9DP91_9GAMM|nr:hypothetical protein [Methylomonas fluvii]MBD9363772.1 hypothetical protein [Methylomonas fluvii]
MELDTEYVKSVSSWDSGGGILVDIVELKSGRVLGITDESVVLYPSMAALEEGEADEAAGMIVLA